MTGGECIVAEAARWIIYGLHEEGCERIRYVGYTKNPRRRLRDHLYESRRNLRRYPLYDWVRSVCERGSHICMRVLEHGVGDWKAAERKWIAEIGYTSLFNATPGGDAVPEISAQARERMRSKLKNRVFSPAHRARIAESKRGRRRPDSAKHLLAFMAAKTPQERSDFARMAQAHLTEEGRQRLRVAGKENTQKRWDTMSAAERALIKSRASEQMKRVWEERRRSRGPVV